jgi:ATP/maltotriose-dependent transcriptional regulator MalT
LRHLHRYAARELKGERVCDEAVHQVLTTKDPVELLRSTFLVQRLNRSIERCR